MALLDLSVDGVSLTRALCDIPSVSGNEGEIADAIFGALRELGHLTVERSGNVIVARTDLGRAERVVLAGHIDTVPIADNLPTWTASTPEEGQVLYGRGTVDMKGGVAVQLRAAATVPEPVRDVTYLFYDNEEVGYDVNGLTLVARDHPDWLTADFAILGEPSNGGVEGGCQGTMRMEVATSGTAAHSARSWMGSNAIHAAGGILDVLRAYRPREVTVDGLLYREGLNAVEVTGGIANNIIPDRCVVAVNYRFAPDRSLEEATAHLEEVFEGYETTFIEGAAGARPGLDHPAAAAFVETVGRPAVAKFGWTDVSRFSALGVPAVNYGPGNPSLAHHDEERCPTAQIEECERVLHTWLAG